MYDMKTWNKVVKIKKLMSARAGSLLEMSARSRWKLSAYVYIIQDIALRVDELDLFPF